MSYKLDFFDSFVCSGSACQNTCCSGWDIALDKETYDFYEASHGAFSKYVKKNIGQTDGNYFIKMTEISGTYQDSVLWWSISRDDPPTSPWMAFMW